MFVENKRGEKKNIFFLIFGYIEFFFLVKVYVVKIWKCWDMFFDKKSIVSVYVYVCKYFFYFLLIFRWCIFYVWSVVKL